MASVPTIQNADFDTFDAWAIFGRYVITSSKVYLYPGASMKQVAQFDATQPIMIMVSSGGAPNCDVFLNGILLTTLTKPNQTLNIGMGSAYPPIPTGKYLLELRQRPEAISYISITAISHSVNSDLNPIIIKSSPGTITGVGSITFSDVSSPANISRFWDFGDGATSTEQTTVHEFTTEGEHTVTLTTERGGMVCLVSVLPRTPLANFNPSVSKCIPGTSITFTNESWKATSWLWESESGIRPVA